MWCFYSAVIVNAKMGYSLFIKKFLQICFESNLAKCLRRCPHLVPGNQYLDNFIKQFWVHTLSAR